MAKQSPLSGAAVSLSAQTLVLGLGFITHPLIGRFLGTESYGIYGIVLSIQTIIGLILTLGVPVALSKFVAQDEEHAQSLLKQSLRIQFFLALTVGILTIVLSPLLSRLLGDTTLTAYIAFISVIVFFQAGYPIFVQYLAGMHQFTAQAFLTSTYAIAKLVGALTLLYFFGLYGALGGFAVGGLLAGLIGWHWARNKGGIHSRRLPIKDFLSFAGTYVLILIGLQILVSLDLFMVKAILKNDTQAGYYNAASTLSRISYFLLQGLMFILLPSVSALTKPGESRARAAKFIKDTLRYLIALIVPAVTLGAATSQELLLFFFFLSDKYLPAAPILTVLMIGLGSLGFYLLLINIVAGAGKAKIGLIITTGLVALSAVLGSILIPRYGLIGAAWQTTISGLVGLTVLAWYTFRTFSIPLPIKSTINVILGTIIATLPTYFWKPEALFLPFYYIALGLVYIAVLFLLREITPQDTARLKKFLPKR